MARLNGSTAVITGASSGIGRGLCGPAGGGRGYAAALHPRLKAVRGNG